MSTTPTDFADRFAIRELIDQYIDRLNHRDWPRYGELLTEDFLWTCSAPVNMRIESRQAMLEMVSTMQQYQHGFVFQMGHGVVVEDIVNNQARCRQTLHIVSDRSLMLGIYYDIVVKGADGQWRFKRRDYQITYMDEAPLPGKIYRQFPDPGYMELPGL